MTLEQFSTIYRALLSHKINCRVGLLLTEISDYRRKKAEQELDEVEKSLAALNDAYVHSAILRGKAQCPVCGEYIGEQPEVAVEAI